ncbi:MAG: TIGR03435 family protein [Acidobacteriaceae bacterium]|nr:TIGR03435 family protein [Acidobacteriaceae bacterium]
MNWKRCVLLCGLCGQMWAQQATTMPEWQKAAGGSMNFEVASIKPDDGPFKPPSFALSADDWFSDPNGRFHADFGLATYIRFAYKLWLTPEEERAMLARLPDWVKSGQRYEIQANAPPHLTKDQYRLMMQSLLAERFGLKIHFEQKEVPVLAMSLAKPGRPGPRLVPHERGVPCGNESQGTYPPLCYGYMARPAEGGMWLNASRGTTMEMFANFVGMTGQMRGEIDRRVVDQTGLTGQWDFTMEMPPPQQMRKPDDPAGPSMLEALRDQLGITLKPSRATVSLPVIDAVTPLNAN